jgi:hypothetical protein
MKIYLRAAGHALSESEDSPFYGDGDGMIVEGPQEGRSPTWDDGYWMPGKLTPQGNAIMAVNSEGEDRDDWLEIAKREQSEGVMQQYWIL